MSEATEAALLAPEDLSSLAEAWDALAARAIEPNVFLARWFAAARLRHLPDRAGATVLVAWRGAGAARRLVGLLVLVRPRGVHFNPLPILRAAELYAPLSTPLLDPERPGETWTAMLDAASRAGIAGLALPFLAEEGAVADAVREVASSHGAPFVVLERHRRAVLESPLGGEAYLRETLEKRRRKEAERQRRRLAEEGDLLFVDVPASDDPAALERFLALEAAGWKGRSGTALASLPQHGAYIREIVQNFAAIDAVRIDLLALDGVPIAGGLLLDLAGQSHFLKIAYDEDRARLSPGRALAIEMLRAGFASGRPFRLDSGGGDRVDPSAYPWGERQEMANAIVALAGRSATLPRLAAAARLRLRRWRDRA